MKGLLERTIEEDAVFYVPQTPYEVPQATTEKVAEEPV